MASSPCPAEREAPQSGQGGATSLRGRTPAPPPSTPAPPAAATAAQPPAYLRGAPPAFVRQADVLFLTAEGTALPAHSQLLARCCTLFAELLEATTPRDGEQQLVPAAAAAEGRPSPAAPLRVPLQGHSARAAELLLQAVYQPHTAAELAGTLHSAAEFGSVADLAAFCGFTGLLEALRGPLSSRSDAMGELVGFDFAGWLDVAERHNLPALRSYCLECVLHLLAAPGSSNSPEEPAVGQLPWEAFSKEHLLLLLDGMASGVRHCMQGNYETRVRIPCTAAATLAAPGANHSMGSGHSTGLHVGGAPWANLHGTPAPTGPSTPGVPGHAGGIFPGSAASQQTQQGAGPSWARGHVATIQVPMLRRQDLQANLPGEVAIASWRTMGDMCGTNSTTDASGTAGGTAAGGGGAQQGWRGSDVAEWRARHLGA